jgi:Tannase and feruloyl esterase
MTTVLVIFAPYSLLGSLSDSGRPAPGAAQVGHSSVKPPMVPLPARASIRPVIDCAQLSQEDFTDVVDAPTRISSAKVAPALGSSPEICKVSGYVAPQVQFELQLPTNGYTGRYLQTGCGGNCGSIHFFLSPSCDSTFVMNGTFAVGANDSGHIGVNAGDALWASDDQQLRIDFGYRADHVTALAARAIIARFYGQAPAYSYFDGCSDGGREALEEAQRYPNDFDGIIAGSPALTIVEAMEKFLWEAHVLQSPSGKGVFTQDKLALLHKAVLDACDGLDGLVDGQIDDPRPCQYDPATIECPHDADGVTCLTGAQVKAAKQVYGGPVDEKGIHLYPGGEPYGSELIWANESAGISAQGSQLAVDFIKYMVGIPDFDWRHWQFDIAGLRKLQSVAPLYDAKNADLTAFRKQGGKLLLWQGTADQAAGSYGTLEYYQAVENKMGGLAATKQFARVFLIPAVYHCGGGYIAYEEDLLGTMVSWVEVGREPDQVTAAGSLPDGAVRTRPVFAYPERAHYKGSGDINDAANFESVMPTGLVDDSYNWAGSLTN